MKRILSMVTMMLLSAIGLNAAGTTAGTIVDNTVTLNYTVGTVPQDAVTADDKFVVDRIIDIVIDSTNSGLETTPGSKQVKLGFTVANEGNDAETWTFSLADSAGDDFNVDDLAKCNLYQAGTLVGLLSQDIPFDADDNLTFEVACDIPTAATDGQLAEIFLTATIKGRADNAAGVDDTAGAVATDAQNVYAEGVSDNSDAKHDGKFTKGSSYKILSAEVSFEKTSIVISDESGTAKAHRIPGATVRYCFDIDNTGSADALGVRLSEDLSVTNKDKLDYVKSGVIVQDSGTCDCAAIADVSGTTTASATTVNIPEAEAGITIGSGKQACAYLEAKIK